MVHGRTNLVIVLLVGALTGCASTPRIQNELDLINASGIPRELDKATLPEYRVEPPDILLIEAVNNIRTPDMPLQVGDTLNIRLGNPEPLSLGFSDDPMVPLTQSEEFGKQFELEKQVRDKFLDGDFVIQPDGKVHLGPVYGSVTLEGSTLEEAKAKLESFLKSYGKDENGNVYGLKSPQVTISLPDIAGKQQVSGEHLLRPDGTISLGIYGSLFVTGMTLDEVRYAVERHLSQFIHRPEVSVDVLAYNSKSIYVITDGGGYGEQVVKLPVTGNETVLDAVAAIDGLSSVSSKKIWVSRPAPSGTDCAQVMDVHWKAITQEGITSTNYQLFPGDRVYISADKMIHTDNVIAKIIAPAERLFGFVMLGTSMGRQIKFYNRYFGFGGAGGIGGGGGVTK